MLKKRAMIAGMISTVVLCGTFGGTLAGCAGAVSDNTEMESVAETVGTDAVVAESAFDEVENSGYGDDGSGESGALVSEEGSETGFTDGSGESETNSSDDSQAKAVERDGKYVYTILDGRVEVPLEHRVEDYIEYGKAIENRNQQYFMLHKIAEELGYRSEPIYSDNPEYSLNWVLENGIQETYFDVKYARNKSERTTGASGGLSTPGFGLSFYRVEEEPIQVFSADVEQDMPYELEKSTILANDGWISYSFDQVVLIIHALEFCVGHFGEDPFFDLLGGVVESRKLGNRGQEYIINKMP